MLSWKGLGALCGVTARVFFRTKSDEQSVIRLKYSDQLVLVRPLIAGEKVSAAWGVRSEQVQKQCLSKLEEVPGQLVLSHAAPPLGPPSRYAMLHSLQKMLIRKRLRLECTAGSPELNAPRLGKLRS